MKYEYLKGSEKDFEGAPEWAMVAVKCDGFDCIDFATSMKEGARCYYQREGRELAIVDAEMWRLIAERRPITESSWNGEGLPPVGCECEYTKESLPGNELTECTIDYIGLSFVVYRDCYGVELTGIIGDIKFRPILSEADKKRDAVIEFITVAIDSHGVDPLNSARFIYDAIAAGKIPGVKLED